MRSSPPSSPWLEGDAGNDTLNGGTGNDNQNGGTGNDNQNGGAGNDRLTGGKHRSSYSGGAGNDTISAANGVREKVACGSCRGDRATVDRVDVVSGCERVTRRR